MVCNGRPGLKSRSIIPTLLFRSPSDGTLSVASSGAKRDQASHRFSPLCSTNFGLFCFKSANLVLLVVRVHKKEKYFEDLHEIEMSLLKHLLGDLKTQIVFKLLDSSSYSEAFSHTAYRQLSQMFIAILFFHGSEYLLAIKYHGKSNVTLKSLLISQHYILAMIISVLEYLLELYFFPELKENWWISNLGLLMVVFGEIIRKVAIITAGRAFTHLIQRHHEDHHKLVTHGVYSIVRHPGYTGFLIWSVGTQIMLCNPVSSVGFTLVVWNFFHRRIPYEEYFLRQFFGVEYEEFAKRVPSGIPFVK
ncbi:hypothetical protein L2E82_20769 [Cichorium intybus]|uniref:Uncharacterized protein n=1 Tax=Cichorium intybus TaxID=13427 RepID=A0ACB9DTY1_CICIN|nr:hypothetical protein L2E82_20769 [Cichorium intybus]